MKSIPTTLATLGCAVAFFAVAGSASAQSTQGTQPKTDIPPALAKHAKISLDSARAIAMKRVTNATIASQELERENGHLIYSFDMQVPGKSGIEEVNVNALNGHIIAVSHEGPAAEKKEAAAEKKEGNKTH